MLTFGLLGRNIAPLHFKTETVADTACRASWFLSTSVRIPGTWAIFLRPGDSKLTPDGVALKWNEHSKTFRTLTFGLLARNIAPLHFKTERLAKTVLRASWFWPTSSRFSGAWELYCSPGDSKLTPDGLGLQWNGHSKFFAGLTLELLGRNRAPLPFKTERVAEAALGASWFWPTSAWVART